MIRTALLSGLIISTFFACKSKQERTKENLNNTLRTYTASVLKDMDSTFTLDSIRVVYVDTISTKDEFKSNVFDLQDSLDYLIESMRYKNEIFKLKFDQYKALNLLNSLGSSRSDLSIFKDDVLEKQKESKEAVDRATLLEKEIDSLKKIYYSNTIDSTNFLYFGVTYKICYSDKSLVQKCVDSAFVNITKEFRVRKK